MAIITLCGSTRFTDQMLIKQWELAKQGHVVMTWNVLPASYFSSVPGFNGDHTHIGDKEDVKQIVDDVHKKKIDLSDEILVINVDDYIGESTKSEILHAINTGKQVKYAYPHTKRDWEGNCRRGVEASEISSNGTGRIDLRPLKIMAANWPEPVRTLILTEPDEISAAEYMERQRIWSRLLAMRGTHQ